MPPASRSIRTSSGGAGVQSVDAYVPLCWRILRWYKVHRRDLPWRKTKNPYRILVSEIMLQQTQVDRVITSYTKFLRTFPTLHALAAAPTKDVITAWAGLGYNRRALFLQRTAQAIVKEHGGTFPKDIHALVALPGIGDYTARAVLSFAFELPVPMMDTNHRKFYRRLFFQGKEVADALLLGPALELVERIDRGRARPAHPSSKHHAYHWNQALMDFMTAVAQDDPHPLVQHFCKKYPLQNTQKKKRVSTPFRQTDRYYRGRIIDALRSAEHISMLSMKKRFPDISEERFQCIVEQLHKDGLIKRLKTRMMLP